MVDRARIGGLILAGGQSRRFGSPKTLATLGDQTLAEHAASLLAPSCEAIAVSGKDAGLSPAFPVLRDPPGIPEGPLAGILAGLTWADANGLDWLVTTPCDTPLLPADFVSRLLAAARASGARLAVFSAEDGVHPLTAIWRPRLHLELSKALAAGHPPVHEFIESIGAAKVHLPSQNLLNINTPTDLATAKAFLARQKPTGEDVG